MQLFPNLIPSTNKCILEMKQRITYLLPEGTRVDKSDIGVDTEHLEFRRADEAAEEWRFTLAEEELVDDVKAILSNTHELHIRWTSALNKRNISPLVSGLPAGFHAFFTPRDQQQDVPLCDLLQNLLGESGSKCHSVEESFSKPPMLSERFAATSTYQYYQNSSLSSRMGELIFRKICASSPPAWYGCDSIVPQLADASYVDLDFDAISKGVTLTVVWPPSSSPNSAHDAVARPVKWQKGDGRMEVGTLQVEKAKEPEELSLGGYLTILGNEHERDGPSKTLFSFPSRHHPLPDSSPGAFKASFQTPTGLHPKFNITLPRQHLTPPKDTCSLHAYWTLPSTIFIDRYQLSDPIFLSSQNLIALRSLAGEQDLEAPGWVIKSWGSAALFQLATPRSDDNPTTDWTITIPTHLRYLPSHTTGHASVDVPWPIVFWACEAEEGLKMATNPFDRVNLGYDGLFGPKTMFYHIPPEGRTTTTTVERVQVPVIDPERATWVPAGTLVAVMLGFLWICWQMLRSKKKN